MHFVIFLRNYLPIFENSPASEGLAPDPLRGRPKKVFPEPKSRLRHWGWIINWKIILFHTLHIRFLYDNPVFK